MSSVFQLLRRDLSNFLVKSVCGKKEDSVQSGLLSEKQLKDMLLDVNGDCSERYD